MNQIVRRAQGRPVRGRDEVGRQRILDGTLAYFRSSGCHGWARKDIAEFMGVTPALISYYFETPAELITAVASPVIESYTKQLQEAIGSDLPMADKLREVIRIFLACNRKDGRLIEAVDTLRRDKAIPDLTAPLFETSASFFHLNAPHEAFDAPFLNRALWGMCKVVQHRSDGLDALDDDQDVGEQPPHLDLVYLLVKNGLWSRSGDGGLKVGL